ncbi:pectin lyase fold/virulence factor [Stachybotrys elegans]|uniref:Pectinesterase n=1 Tax=Stachybotrys elegans TaxID=80388 RepID=A0A8K0SP97_9HYPO|nr:pectin lyase fold/virulence factor [Stachybotrys elegans]
MLPIFLHADGFDPSQCPERCVGNFARTRPKCGSIVVDLTGQYPGSHKTISSAVSALNTTTTSEQHIFVFPGVYHEQVYLGRLAGPLGIQGYTCDYRSYAENQAVVSYNLSRTTPGLTNNDQTATIRLWTANVTVHNLDVENTAGPAGAQALALSAQNTNQGFYGCVFKGYQDTIYANEGRQIYAKSYVNGAVDFIFGLRAVAWFDQVDIETIGPGWITANGRDADNNTSSYVFNNCHINGTSGQASTYLGRPWRQWSRVLFQSSELGDVVHPSGWSRWDDVQPVNNLEYAEYNNFGPGAMGERADFSTKLDTPKKIEELLGPDYEQESWVDTRYL